MPRLPAARLCAQFLAVLAALLVFSAAARADAKGDGRAMIQKMADQVVAILSDKATTRAAREEKFRAVFRANFDVATIAAWVMGAPWQQATPAQRADYLALFESYIVKVYTGQLATFKGETLKVVAAEDDGTGVSVTTAVTDPEAGRTIEVKWRLRAVQNRLRVRDVVIENISMSVNQRREFASVYQQRGGTVDGLLAALREKIAELDRK